MWKQAFCDRKLTNYNTEWGKKNETEKRLTFPFCKIQYKIVNWFSSFLNAGHIILTNTYIISWENVTQIFFLIL